MEWFRPKQQTSVPTSSTRSKLSIFRKLFWTWAIKSHDNSTYHYDSKRNGYNKYIHTIRKICLILATSVIAAPAHAADVGGVSATANPIANSSGSVTNQAIQVLQGPYITNTYGGGIQCQGATMNITPYVTGTGSFKRPFERYYDDPVYDVHDADDDGQIDNPGNILYYVPTRTNQTENYNVSLGLSATWSRPLDKDLQQQCKDAAAANIALMTQTTANKRLDFEIARLKNCGELMKAGIMFHPKSPYFKVCADVVLVNPPGVVAQHTHELTTNDTTSSSSTSVEEEVPSSDDTNSPEPQNDSVSQGFFQGLRWPWSKPALSQDETLSGADQLGVLQVGQMHQQP